MPYNIDLNKYYNSDKLLLTPNQRLARELVSVACKQKSSKVLSNFNIQSINDFITKLFDSIAETGLLDKPYFVLNHWQRELLFKKIISQRAQNNADNFDDFAEISANSFYKKAVQAWSITQQWQLDWSDWGNYIQPESKLFSQWADLYKQHLAKHHYLDPDDKLNIIINLLNQNEGTSLLKFVIFSEIDFYGFDDYSVQIINFITKLKAASIKVNILDQSIEEFTDIEHVSNNIAVYPADNQQDEYHAVANWAKHHYDNNVEKIGIIVPDLAKHRAELIKVFEQIIPERQIWNISGGEFLSKIAVIKAAVIILEVVISEKVNLSDLRFLLKSDYYLKYVIAANIELPAHDAIRINSLIDQLLSRLENDGYRKLTLSEVIFNINNFNKPLADILSICNSTIKEQELRLPSNWSQLFSKLLLDLGWPAGHSDLIDINNKLYKLQNISSVVYQAIGQWHNCLQQLFLLDNIYGSVAVAHLFKDFKELLDNTPFQIQTDQNKIDILGMLEGAGIHYDKLWLFNLTSDVWPSIPDPNPFIPIDVQRKYNLPHATAERELTYAKNLTKRYLSSAADIVISYSKMQNDQENHLSALISQECKIYCVDSYINNGVNTKDIYLSNDKSTFSIKYFLDEYGPKITKAHIQSGVKAIKLQAACPFRSFSETRLNAVNSYKLNIGPSPQIRGEIIHKVLETIFNEFNTKQKLCDFKSNLELYNSKLHEIIFASINLFKSRYQHIFTTGIIIIETELIYDIIDQWLDLELVREDFTVFALEKKYLLKLNNIEFNVRVDRIDQMVNDEQDLVIIDYKTKEQKISNLYAEQLLEPQLPLYFFINDLKNAAAVLYAQVIEDKPGYSGVSSKEFNIPGCRHVSEWEFLINKWENNLNKLADEYSAGYASVKPIHKEKTCNQCSLLALCRKDEYV
jgi:ATP-dependent helicase/nuclease subunit B